ncbi:hypothetical protein, partial [Mycoplasma yeatsii]|uniref:hypothetical protein n=1 Tax=Mycoplasma yeatsii TaxID=51365 RepID=UPI000561B3D3
MLKSFLLLSILGLTSQPITNIKTLSQPVHAKQLNNKLSSHKVLDKKSDLEKDLMPLESYYNDLKRSTSEWSAKGLINQLNDFLDQHNSKIPFLNIQYADAFINAAGNFVCYQDYTNSSKSAYSNVVAYYREIVKEQLIVYLSAKVMQDCFTYLINSDIDDSLVEVDIVTKWFNIVRNVFNTDSR